MLPVDSFSQQGLSMYPIVGVNVLDSLTSFSAACEAFPLHYNNENVSYVLKLLCNARYKLNNYFNFFCPPSEALNKIIA